MTNTKQGMFISFEGIDGCGKTTQAALLVNRLQKIGKEVLFLREPGGTTISEKIRRLLLDKKYKEMTMKGELFLFSAARTQLVSEVIRPALQKGTIVVCDRFYDSTTAYQGYGRGLNILEVTTINAIAVDGISPTITFLLDVDIQEILRRRKVSGLITDRMEDAGTEFFERVRKGYLEIAKQESHRYHILDGMRSIDELHHEIWNYVQPRLESLTNKL